MEIHLMNQETRSNPQVVKWVGKINEISRQIQIYQKDVRDREREMAQIHNDIDLKRAMLTTALLNTSILVNDLAENGEQLDLEDIFIQENQNQVQREAVAHIATYLRWIYTVDPLDEPTEDFRNEVLMRTPDLN